MRDLLPLLIEGRVKLKVDLTIDIRMRSEKMVTERTLPTPISKPLCKRNPFKNPWQRASTETSEVSLEIERIIGNTKPQPAPETGQSSTQAPEVSEKNQIDAVMKNLRDILDGEREKLNLTNRRMSKASVKQHADALKQVLLKENITTEDVKNIIDRDIKYYQKNLNTGSLTRISWQRLTDYTTMLKQIKDALNTKTN